MKRLLQVTLLASALVCMVALLAPPLSAAEPAAPICPAEPAPGAASDAEVAQGDAVEAAGDLLAGGAAEAAPEPRPLADPIPVPPPQPQMCGLVVCPAGTRCCNPLCSACTPPGVECTMGDCGHGPTS